MLLTVLRKPNQRFDFLKFIYFVSHYNACANNGLLVAVANYKFCEEMSKIVMCCNVCVTTQFARHLDKSAQTICLLPQSHIQKLFWFFFAKKNIFLF